MEKYKTDISKEEWEDYLKSPERRSFLCALLNKDFYALEKLLNSKGDWTLEKRRLILLEAVATYPDDRDIYMCCKMNIAEHGLPTMDEVYAVKGFKTIDGKSLAMLEKYAKDKKIGKEIPDDMEGFSVYYNRLIDSQQKISKMEDSNQRIVAQISENAM